MSKDKRTDQLADDDRQPVEVVHSSFRAQKQKAVIAASRHVKPDADARKAFGFMPMTLKGSHIRWRGL